MSDNKFALVIDDSVSIRQQVVSILRGNDDVGEVLEADNPDQALEVLLQHDGNLQFIVSDWNLSGMPLKELLKLIQYQPRLAGAPLLLMVDDGNQNAKMAAKETGATAVLSTPLDPERLLVMSMAVTGTVDRRRAKRITPFIDCEIDLGFAKSQKSQGADIVNISDSGILLRTAVPTPGTGYVYDIANVSLRPAVGESIKLSAKILRIEAAEQYSDVEKKVFMALAYENMNESVGKSLRQYLIMNDLQDFGGEFTV
ncbi:MAG: response regulator [Gammaproteobacteria bacterium]|jgi:two-component system chemotaxis response regulator CheY